MRRRGACGPGRAVPGADLLLSLRVLPSARRRWVRSMACLLDGVSARWRWVCSMAPGAPEYHINVISSVRIESRRGGDAKNDRSESGPRLGPVEVAGPRGRRLVEVLLLALRLIGFTFFGPVRRVARSRCRLLQLVVGRTNSLEHEVGPVLVFRCAGGLAVGVPLERLFPISLFEFCRRASW